MTGYGTILILFCLSLLIALVLYALAVLIGPKVMNARKARPFECGNPPLGPIARRAAVKFYLVALLFIVFDMEAVFLYPWAVVFRDIGWLAFWSMLSFVFVLGIGLVYVWKKGALDW